MGNIIVPSFIQVNYNKNPQKAAWNHEMVLMNNLDTIII